jgi:hypothetical protein
MNEQERNRLAQELISDIQADLADHAGDEMWLKTTMALALEVIRLRYELKIEKDLNKEREIRW